MVSEENLDESIRKAIDLLKAHHVVFEHGLSDSEVERTQTRFGFRFPPDLKAFWLFRAKRARA
jgi:hypothetical protein